MKKIFFLLAILTAVILLPACQYAHGDGPDVATPAKQKKKVPKKKNPRSSNWLTENMHRERVGRKDINKPGGNDNFQVFPLRDGGKRRSEKLRDQSSPFFWR